MSFAVGVLLLAVVTAMACALPGVFVVVRGQAMLVDAISHAILPGIVVGFALTGEMQSPALVVGAALAGLLVVLGTEAIARTGLITGDAPQGLVFPALFSAGVLMVSASFGDIHLDTHAVLVGDLNLVAFEQIEVAGREIGPKYLYVMLALLALNSVVIGVLYRRLVAATFDPEFARVAGLAPQRVGLALMFCVAMTVTGAFNAAGAILVVALVVVPAATARLVADRLPAMIAIALAVAGVGAIAGFGLAYAVDAPTSAGMAVFYGLLFAATLAARGGRRGRRTTGARRGERRPAARNLVGGS
ncbi:MAG TPA: metal ABC transporter permease [Dietzia timorensis]|uniref:Metal ABC transporter permease n=1 Tax=Dietzia timorensis TaxID=499555 RepID=A0A921F358_9ACTN|nr:metal ABC transporter permease [Dietzia timorensis]HJE90565.1 metal ABC transporter permease [Dietzia timorensis]